MATRKKPGRPRKKLDVCPVNTYGIVASPINPNDCVELVYNQPQLLKCIVLIFKEYDCDEIAIEFHKDRVVFAGRDHSTRVMIQITINAADVNLYYSDLSALEEQETESPDTSASTGASPDARYCIVVKRDNLEIVAAIIEKTHYKLMMSLHRDDLSSLFIMLSNCDFDSEDMFEVSVVPRANTCTDNIEMPDVSQYPLEFTLDSHHLRRKISELKKIAPGMVIKKSGAANLEISFGANSRVSYTGMYSTAPKIKLRSTIPDDETFIVTMNIGRIRPLMAVNLPGGITFFANHVDPLIIQIGLDQRGDSHYAIVARLLINTAH